MSFTHLNSLLRHIAFSGIAAGAGMVLAAGLASAQTSPAPSQASSAGISSSNDPGSVQIAKAVAPEGLSALPSAPRPAASEGGGENKGLKQKLAGNYALEIGGGASIPTDKTYITWGEQFTVGGGYNFNKRFALLAEYQFMDNKLPGALIAQTGANGGHVHIWSLTLDPVLSLFPKSSNDVYVTGGGGFYRGTVNAVVGHFSSNQGGFNIGGGYQHRMGGMYQDSKMKFFVEARYVYVLTPAVNGITPSGLGETTVAAGTKLIPVSVGLRW